MSERIPQKGDEEFGRGAFREAAKRAKRSREKRSGKERLPEHTPNPELAALIEQGQKPSVPTPVFEKQGARKKESSRDEWLEATFKKISAEKKPTGAMFLDYLNDAGGRSAPPEVIEEAMELASQRLGKGVFNELKKIVSGEHAGQPEARKAAPAPLEQKPAVNEQSSKAEDIKAPPAAEGISPEDSEKKSPEPAQQEPVVESEPVPAVEAEPVAQTAEAESAPREEEMDTAQRVAMKLAEEIPDGERTRAEWYRKLRELVSKAPSTEGSAEAASANGSERMKTLKEYLANRLNELNGEAQEEGVVGRSFRSLGETYDKLGWKSKLAIGVSLGLGAGALSGVSLAGAAACMSGIAVQRIAGLSSAFLKYEKNAQEEKWGKEKAMAKAVGRAAFMTGGMLLLVEGVKEAKEGVAYLKEQHVAEATQEWLKQHWPSQDQIKEYLPGWLKERLPFAGTVKSAAPEEAGSASPEAAVQARPQEELPLVTPEEAEEHTRQVLAAEEGERLREAFGGSAAAADAAKEASAHEVAPSPFEETDKHIAAAEEHFINVRKLAAEASLVGEDTTPKHSQEEWDALAMDNKLRMVADSFVRSESGEILPGDEVTLGYLDRLTPEQLKIVDTYVNLLHQKVSNAEHYMPEERTAEAPFGRDANNLPFASEQEAKDFADLKHATHDPRTTGEWPGSQQHDAKIIETPVPTTLEVSPTEAHIYATDSKDLFVHGGSWEKQEPVIRSYLEAHPKETVFSADMTGKHRIPWSLVDGRLTPGTPVRTGGFFGFGSSWAEAPDPKEFTRVVPLEHSQSVNPDHAPQASVVPETPASPAPEASRIESVSNPHVAETTIESGGGTEAVVHEFEHLKFGSVEGTFKYSPNGSVQSFSFEGTVPNPRAAESLLNESYREILASRPGGNLGMDSRAVSMNALKVFQYQQALEELTRRGVDKSPESDFLKKGIKFIVEGTEKRYGNVFKDIDAKFIK